MVSQRFLDGVKSFKAALKEKQRVGGSELERYSALASASRGGHDLMLFVFPSSIKAFCAMPMRSRQQVKKKSSFDLSI